MKTTRTALLSALALSPVVLFAQLQSDAEALDQMRYDVKYLASDQLEGREAGTPGEKLAADYVAAKFGNVGLVPFGDSASYLQAFTFQADPFLGQFAADRPFAIEAGRGLRSAPLLCARCRAGQAFEGRVRDRCTKSWP
jgi:hypothetical protein